MMMTPTAPLKRRTFRTLAATCLNTVTAISITVMAGASSAWAAAPTLETGTLQVGMEVSYPPFESWQGDQVVGFDADVAHALAQHLNTTVKFEDTKFTSLILGLQSKKFDTVISGMYVTPERLKQADAIPYAKTGALIIVPKNGEISPQTEQDLCGVTVGLQQGTTWVNALGKLSTEYCQANGKAAIEIREFPSAPEVTQALMSGNVQAQLEIAGAARMFVERTRGRLKISSPDLVYPQTLGIYVKQDNTALKTALAQALQAMRDNGAYQKLLDQYKLQPVTADD